jgi:Fe2+ transport system protein FeoA
MKLHWSKKTDPSPSIQPLNLATAPINSSVRVTGFGNLPQTSLKHLQAYGLLPGRIVTVLACRPMTIIQIEHTELALEKSVAALVVVEAVDNPV